MLRPFLSPENPRRISRIVQAQNQLPAQIPAQERGQISRNLTYLKFFLDRPSDLRSNVTCQIWLVLGHNIRC